MRRWLGVVMAVICLSSHVSEAKSNETIWIFSEDLETCIRITIWKNIQGPFALAFRKDWPQSTLLYSNPPGRWDTGNPANDYLVFENLTGSLMLVEHRRTDEWSLWLKDGEHYFTNWKRVYPLDPEKMGIGMWTRPDNFEELTVTFVIPERFSYGAYEASQRGDWKLNHNSLTYFAKNVNDVVFDIRFR